jgi:hypothetical protein
MPGLHVVVVVRWPEVRAYVVAVLRDLGHRAVALDPVAPPAFTPDVVVRDAGCDVSHAWPRCGVVVLSGGWTDEERAAAEVGGAVCLAKPFARAHLAAAVARAARRPPGDAGDPPAAGVLAAAPP